MRLASVEVSNFKSVKCLSFDFPQSNILVLVGPNNAGKTNIVRAIDLLCGESWVSSERMEDIDFYGGDRSQEIKIDLAFDDGHRAAFSSLAKFVDLYGPGGQKEYSGGSKLKELFPCTYLGADRTLDTHLNFYDWTLIGKIRKAFHRRAQPVQDRLREKFEELVAIFEDVEGFSDFKSDLTGFFEEMQADTPIKLGIDFKPFTPSNYFKTMQVLATDPRQEGLALDLKQLGEGARNMALLALLRSYAKNFKTGGGTSGILALEEPELFLHPQARRHLASVLRDLAESGLQVIISTHSASFIETEFFDSIGQVFKVKDADGSGRFETRIRCVTRAALRDHCVETGVPPDKVTEENLPLFYKATANARLNEAFFARVVVLVEGETEELALPEYLAAIGLDCDLRGVSVISVGGKNQIPKYWRLFSRFRPPLIVVFDNDDDGTGRKRKSNENIASCFGLTIDDLLGEVKTFKLLEAKRKPATRIVVLEKDFETALRKDLVRQHKMGAATFDRLDAEARDLIKPIGNQSKGAIARQIARGLAREIPSFTPGFVSTLQQEIESKIGRKQA